MKKMRNVLIVMLTLCALACQDNLEVKNPELKKNPQAELSNTNISAETNPANFLGNFSVDTYLINNYTTDFTPAGLALDRTTRNLYVADPTHHCVYQITESPSNPSLGNKKVMLGVSKLPGYGYASGSGAGVDSNVRLNYPTDVAVGSSGQILYVCDRYNNRIRRYDIKNDFMTTIVGGGQYTTSGAAGFDFKLIDPQAIALSQDEKHLYIADIFSILDYDVANDIVTVKLTLPSNNKLVQDIEADPSVPNGIIYYMMSDLVNYTGNPTFTAIKKHNFNNNTSTQIYYHPYGVYIPESVPRGFGIGLGLDKVFCTEYSIDFSRVGYTQSQVFSIDNQWSCGSISDFVDGPCGTAKFSSPVDVAVYAKEGVLMLYVADRNNHTIRKMTGSY